MRRAATFSVAAHKRVMRATRPGRYEFEIEAEFLYELGQHGIRTSAYPSIVASGANACVLHYVKNSDLLKDGELLLIDAGAEVDYYASDITRTFPVSGTFSQYQKIIYELVLDAQIAAIKRVKPGNRWIDPHEAAVRVLTKGLIKLGLLKGDLPRSIKDESYKAFYMHRTGHWLGMDVHDVGLYKKDGQWRTFEPGMVLTVEPGLYISPDCLSVDEVWRGIGVRIEDDVLVTRKGNEVLTEDLPKTVADVEGFLAGALL
ncbi:MAG: M24B family metallopeptidase [Methylococcaceae bacterium]